MVIVSLRLLIGLDMVDSVGQEENIWNQQDFQLRVIRMTNYHFYIHLSLGLVCDYGWGNLGQVYRVDMTPDMYHCIHCQKQKSLYLDIIFAHSMI